MKILARCAVLLTVPIFLIGLAGCQKESTPSSPPSGDADAQAQEGYQTLEAQLYAASQSGGNTSNIDFTAANARFREALNSNPNHPLANFGAGFTEVLCAINDQGLRSVVGRWEGTNTTQGLGSTLLRFGIPSGTKDMSLPQNLLAKSFPKIIERALNNPPTIADLQAALRDHLLPRLDYAIARFALVEQNSGFRFTITGKMQGNTNLQSVYIDLTEVYLMDAAVQWMKSVVEGFLIYQFQLDSYTPAAVAEALRQTNTTFFVRASDGLTRGQSSKNAFLAAIDRIRSSINFLKNEKGDQSAHVIKVNNHGSGGVNSAALDTTLAYLQRIENAFSAPFTVTLNDADSDGNLYTIQVSVGQLFTNPPQYPKQAWLPTYTIDTSAHGDILWHWQAQDYASFNFPDPTFSGLFPGMTNNALKRIMYIDYAFGWQASVYLHDYSATTPYPQGAKLIVGTTTYLPKKDRYSWNWQPSYGWSRSFLFCVTYQAGESAQLVMTANNTDIPLTLSRPAVVTYKQYQSIDGDVQLASQSTSAQVSYSSVYYNLVNYGMYKIERSTNGTTFSVIDSTSSSSYYDYNVTHGTTYWYRAKLQPSDFWSYYGYIYAYRPNNYTNTVSITP